MSQRGSASVVGAAVIAVIVALGIGLVDVTRLLTARARAEAAADAAALAAAPLTYLPGRSPAAEAAAFAAANGGRLVRCSCPVERSPVVRQIEVEVEVAARLTLLGSHTVRVVGRAEFDPVRALGGQTRRRGPAGPLRDLSVARAQRSPSAAPQIVSIMSLATT